MSAHKKFQLKTQNYWLAVDPYMPPRRTGMHNKANFVSVIFIVNLLFYSFIILQKGYFISISLLNK